MATQVSLLDGALASAGTLAIQTNGTTSAITISSAQVATFVNNPIMTGLTASRAVFTDGSKGLTSNAITGTGNVVMSASPTLTGTVAGASLQLSSLTSGRVTYTTTSGLLTDSANLLYSGTDLTVYGLTVGRGAGAVSSNTAVGASAFASGSNSGGFGVAVGTSAGASNTTATGTTAVGWSALQANTTGSNNAAFGADVMFSNTTGAANTAVGNSALRFNTTASNNTAVGYQSLYLNTTGIRNTALGQGALYSNTTGDDNIAIGTAVLNSNTTGLNNIAIGRQALTSNTTASNNTAVGYQAGYSTTTGTQNTFFGRQAGFSLTTNSYCTFVGDQSGYSTTGTNNTFVGIDSGYYVTTGAKNTIIGRYDGNMGGLDIRTASNYIVLSDGDGNPRGYFNNSGNFVLGTTNAYMQIPLTSGNAYLGSVTSTSAFQISFNSLSAGVQLASGGTSWGTFSDEKIKDIIEPITDAVSKVSTLRAVIGKYKNDEEGTRRSFLIAQDVQVVLPEAVTSITQEDGSEILSLAYTETIPLLVAAIKELKAEVDSLKSQLKGA